MTSDLVFLESGLIFLVVIMVPWVARRWRGLNEVVAFWVAYVSTRTLGASLADWVAKPSARGSGPGLGDGPVTGVLLVATVAIVALIVRTRYGIQQATRWNTVRSGGAIPSTSCPRRWTLRTTWSSPGCRARDVSVGHRSRKYTGVVAIPDYPGHFSVSALEPPGVLPDGFVLLDVREESEFAAGHAPGAVNFPLSRIRGRVDELPQSKVILVCRSGTRSAMAMDWLKMEGYRAWNMRSGMLEWKLAGLPIVRDDGSPGTLI